MIYVIVLFTKMASTSRNSGDSFLEDDEIEDVLFESDEDDNFDLSESDDQIGENLDSESEESENEQAGAGDSGNHRPRIRHPSIDDPNWESCDEDSPDVVTLPFDTSKVGFIPPFGERPSTPLDFFQMFFSISLFTEIARETNRYIREKIAKITPLQRYSIWWDWKDVTVHELMAFHGVLLNMGRQAKLSMKDFFSESWVDSSAFFKDVFSRKRFCQIFWALHVSPPSDSPARSMQSRASKLKSVLDFIGSKFLELYRPSQFIAVDESTVSFKGRVTFKMYNPQKPTKWGLRLYVLADSTNGYVSALIPYYGSYTTNNLIRPDLPFTSRVILHLVNALQSVTQQKGYHLYTDRFYSSVDLANELKANGVYLTGTVMLNRKGLPIKMKKKYIKNLQKHKVIAFRHKQHNILALSWKDKRVVSMISTCHNSKTELVTRKIKNNVTEQFPKPCVISDYTAKMGGVDRNDHYCSSYGFAKKSLKWWRKLYFWLLEVSVVNSFILYNSEKKKNNEPVVRHVTFRKQLIEQLVSDVRNVRRKRGRPTSIDNDAAIRMNGLYHSIKANESKKTKDCVVCSDRKTPGGRKETIFYCDTCPRKPGLHPNNCFDKYHTQKIYRQ